MSQGFSRRSFAIGLSVVFSGWRAFAKEINPQNIDSPDSSTYRAIKDPPFTIQPLNLAEIDPNVLRQEVTYRGSYPPDTVIVNIAERRLYLVESDSRALRFGIGVGRERRLNFRGSAVIGRKAKWPSWTPTPNMIARIPKYAEYAHGMPGGPKNPLGARALYLYRDGQDTHFRVHGTNEPNSIGKAVSSGCIRLFNHDIIYLYNRLEIGTSVIVEQGTGSATT